MAARPGRATSPRRSTTTENGGLSADGLTWTIKIKPGLKWSDGEPLTANDVAYTYNLILDDNFSAFTNYLPFTDSITAQDDTTLIWKTTKPSIAPLIPPWIYILPEHTWSEFKDKDAVKAYSGFPDQVTSGPFRVTQWNKDEDWTLTKNANWWGTEPTIDRVIFKKYSNEETMVQDLESRRDRLRREHPRRPVPIVAGQGRPGDHRRTSADRSRSHR